ncbi:MAG: hypothetical protein D6718_02255 [Acidobacteria bacterium]|nr:MAG: hypothetical protein D6718_02255 [Acidobacteriota bacterium]
MTRDDPIGEALRLLAREIRRRAERHPAAHLPPGRDERVVLRLRLPLDEREGALEEAAERARSEIERSVGATMSRRAAFRPGHVYCLRCGSADCGHGTPQRAREVFAGFGPTGMPRFVDLGQFLLERHDPRVERLYAGGRGLVAEVVGEAELTWDLLPSFRDRANGYRIHGQVVAGWFRVSDAAGVRQPIAVTLQLVSTRAGRRRRYALNAIGTGPDGEPLDRLGDRLDSFPWSGPLRWAQGVLDGVRGAEPDGELFRKRIGGLLTALARRLERGERARGRRTAHAEERHGSGERPTRLACADLARAAPDDILFDARRGTLIVLGERGRAHVFNEEGRLVTSVRYPPEAIERKRARGLWRPASREQIEALREQVRSP